MPHAHYARMQREAPVYPAAAPGGPLHLVTRHGDVPEVVLDPATFSSRFDTGGLSSHSEQARRSSSFTRRREATSGWGCC
jgi:hypothetical protein